MYSVCTFTYNYYGGLSYIIASGHTTPGIVRIGELKTSGLYLAIGCRFCGGGVVPKYMSFRGLGHAYAPWDFRSSESGSDVIWEVEITYIPFNAMLNNTLSLIIIDSALFRIAWKYSATIQCCIIAWHRFWSAVFHCTMSCVCDCTYSSLQISMVTQFPAGPPGWRAGWYGLHATCKLLNISSLLYVFTLCLLTLQAHSILDRIRNQAAHHDGVIHVLKLPMSHSWDQCLVL